MERKTPFKTKKGGPFALGPEKKTLSQEEQLYPHPARRSGGWICERSKVSSHLILVYKKQNPGDSPLLPDPSRSAAFVSPGARRSVSRTRPWRHPRHNNGFKGHMRRRAAHHRRDSSTIVSVKAPPVPAFIACISARWPLFIVALYKNVLVSGCVHHGHRRAVPGLYWCPCIVYTSFWKPEIDGNNVELLVIVIIIIIIK